MIETVMYMTKRGRLGMPVNFLKNSVRVEVNHRVAKIELDNPNVLHGIKKDMVKELIQNFKEISISDDIQIVILTGKEGAFYTDLSSSILNETENESDFYYTMDLINELITTLYSMPKLTITGINGSASGLGMSLALATDHVLVSETSQLNMDAMKLGLIPIGGAHFFLARRLGEDKAKHLIWNAKTLTALESLQLGLINEISQGDIQQAMDHKVHRWIQSPVQAMIKTKMILGEKNRPQLLKVLELEKFAQYRMIQTEDFQESCQALHENRRPNYIGK
jgi:2-(1,2-epoxy-1,2-dihydrophenyl)acetyl-CoA isomerase